MNGQQQQAEIGKQKVNKPAYKFLIGFIGGFCAAVFPRLMAALTLPDSSDVLLRVFVQRCFRRNELSWIPSAE